MRIVQASILEGAPRSSPVMPQENMLSVSGVEPRCPVFSPSEKHAKPRYPCCLESSQARAAGSPVKLEPHEEYAQRIKL